MFRTLSRIRSKCNMLNEKMLISAEMLGLIVDVIMILSPSHKAFVI